MSLNPEAMQRRLGRPLYGIVAVAAVLTSVLILWYTFYGVFMPRRQLANAVLGGSILIYYFNNAYRLLEEDNFTDWRSKGELGWDLLLGSAGFLAAAYVHLNYFRWQENSTLFIFNNVDLLVGALVMFVVLDMTYRSFGAILAGAVVLALVYGLVGEQLPGLLGHSGLGPTDLIARESVILGGVYGTLLQIAATWVAIFLVFAGMVEAHRGFDFIDRLGQRAATLSRSGIAQSAVISSMFIGMLTGGSTVNVALTGSFTIPMMKEHNVPPRVAGAVESLASSGGQILPPIMGLAAFLIADFIGVRYADVVVAAIIPALLFYGTIAISVHIVFVSAGWSAKADALPDTGTRGIAFALEGLQYLLPIVVLMYALVVERLPIMLSGAYTIGVFLLLRFLYTFTPVSDDPLTVSRLSEFVRNTVDGLRIGAIRLAPFLGLLGALGMLIDILSYSGLGLRIATWIVIAGGESFVVILLLAMLVSLLFGLGMPTPAAYILVAAVLAPSLVRIGVADLTAHFYVFYFALLSAITPPVAVAVAVASEIAESDFVETAKTTLVMGGPVFVIPFLFIAQPSLIYWTYPDVIFNSLLAAIGIVTLIFALTGTNGRTSFSLPERGLLVVTFPVMAFAPMLSVRVLAAVIAIVVALRRSIVRRFRASVPEGA